MEDAIKINPNVLIWCREQAGLTLEAAAQQADINALKATKNNKEISPVERLFCIEQGIIPPTFSQLKALEKVYQRPFMTFFLNQPPVVTEKFIDFRTIDSLPHETDTPEFARLKRRLINLQEELSIIERENLATPLDFVSSIKISDDVEKIVSYVRKKLNFSFENQKSLKDDEELFRVLRDKIQEIGVFVVLEGDLGSYHSAISTEEFRGIAITDPFAPLIAINSNDYKQAMTFTLLHELAHIGLGDNSISNISISSNAIDVNEIFCNKFAAEFLIPRNEIIKTFSNVQYIDENNILSIMSTFAKQFKVSLMVMARRLYDVGKINNSVYQGVIGRIQASIRQKKRRQKEISKSTPSRNKLDQYRLGNKVITTILNATYNGKMSLVDASVLLNVNSLRLNRIQP